MFVVFDRRTDFKGIEFDPLLRDSGSNAFTMSTTRWVELTGASGLKTKNNAGGGTYAQSDSTKMLVSYGMTKVRNQHPTLCLKK